MGSRFRISLVFALLISATVFPGCVSYRILKSEEGLPVSPPGGKIQVEKTTIGEVLFLLGAPDKLAVLEGKDLLIYQRALYRENGLSVGIPLGEILGPSIDIAAHGGLFRYDTLALFFTPDGILRDIVFEKDSSRPFLKTLWTEQQ
ncbi:MAG: hypothetical protein JSU78_07240 [Deltaproteobacteria bacterium]|nr:MAG: hypothetical protein JSU78_07240 [Deltaproteobacteria bacterium]